MMNSSPLTGVSSVEVAQARAPAETTETTDESFERTVEKLFDDELEQAVVDTKQMLDAVSARFHVLVGELDRRQVAEVEHGLTTTQWLKSRCRMAGIEASGTVKTARAMRDMPTVTSGALAGSVPAASVKLLGVAHDQDPEAFADHEAILGDAATYLDTKDLRRAVEHWRQQVDHAGAVEEAAQRRERRRVSVDQTYDGMWAVSGDLDPESGHIVSTAIRAGSDSGNLDPDDDRTPGQRRADALTGICRFWLDHSDDASITSGGSKPHLTVTIDYEVLSGAGEHLPEIDGAVVEPETARRLACDAGIIPVVLGPSSEPLDIGRKTRTIPPAIRRAVELRDGRCRWDGCDAPMSWCDVHHITSWADGGRTALDNLMLLCRKHHTMVHEGGRAPP